MAHPADLQLEACALRLEAWAAARTGGSSASGRRGTALTRKRIGHEARAANGRPSWSRMAREERDQGGPLPRGGIQV